METEEQELRKLEKQFAEDYLSLALGLFATAILLLKSFSAELWWFLAILGIFSAILSVYLYLAVFCKFERNKFIEKITTTWFKHIALFLGFSALGLSIVEPGDMTMSILGTICIGLGYAILIVSTWKGAKRRKAMGTKGRKNPSSKK